MSTANRTLRGRIVLEPSDSLGWIARFEGDDFGEMKLAPGTMAGELRDVLNDIAEVMTAPSRSIPTQPLEPERQRQGPIVAEDAMRTKQRMFLAPAPTPPSPPLMVFGAAPPDATQIRVSRNESGSAILYVPDGADVYQLIDGRWQPVRQGQVDREDEGAAIAATFAEVRACIHQMRLLADERHDHVTQRLDDQAACIAEMKNI